MSIFNRCVSNDCARRAIPLGHRTLITSAWRHNADRISVNLRVKLSGSTSSANHSYSERIASDPIPRKWMRTVLVAAFCVSRAIAIPECALLRSAPDIYDLPFLMMNGNRINIIYPYNTAHRYLFKDH